MTDLVLMSPEAYEPIRQTLRGHLPVMRLTGEIDDEQMSEIGEALDLFDKPEPVDRTPRSRAMPADWNRRGAVGA